MGKTPKCPPVAPGVGWALTTKRGLDRTKKWKGFDNLRQRFVLSILSTWLSFVKFRKKSLHRNSVCSLFLSIGKDQKKDFNRPGGGIGGRGRHSGAFPPNENFAHPSSKDYAPKKVTGSVPLKCSSRPETLKILVVTLEFVSKNCFFADFAIKTLFCGTIPKIVKIRAFFQMKVFFFFLVFTPELVKIRNENLRFLVHTLEFGALNFLCPPKT